MTETPSEPLIEFATGPAKTAADETAKVFEAAGERIANALESAAKSGEFSFNALAESVARDLAKMAISELITSPLSSALGSIGSSIGGSLFSGLGQNSSGPVVGTANTAAPVTVNMTVSGVTDAASFNRSQGQISSALARAVASGQRYL